MLRCYRRSWPLQLAVSVVLGMRAFDLETPFWSRVGHVFVCLTLVTSIGSCFSYLARTRRFLLEEASR